MGAGGRGTGRICRSPGAGRGLRHLSVDANATSPAGAVNPAKVLAPALTIAPLGRLTPSLSALSVSRGTRRAVVGPVGSVGSQRGIVRDARFGRPFRMRGSGRFGDRTDRSDRKSEGRSGRAVPDCRPPAAGDRRDHETDTRYLVDECDRRPAAGGRSPGRIRLSPQGGRTAAAQTLRCLHRDVWVVIVRGAAERDLAAAIGRSGPEVAATRPNASDGEPAHGGAARLSVRTRVGLARNLANAAATSANGEPA